MISMKTKAYLLRVDERLIPRLERLAQKYMKDSGNKIAADVITIYLDFWERAEEARFAVIHSQEPKEPQPIAEDAVRQLESPTIASGVKAPTKKASAQASKKKATKGKP